MRAYEVHLKLLALTRSRNSPRSHRSRLAG